MQMEGFQGSRSDLRTRRLFSPGLIISLTACLLGVPFGEVTELRSITRVGLKAGGRRRTPRHVQADLDGGGDVRDLLADEAGVTPRTCPLRTRTFMPPP